MRTPAPHLPPFFCQAPSIFQKIYLALTCLAGWLLCLPHGHAQGTLGQHPVASYTRHQYGAGTQNWALVQDGRHRLYIANNEGLLVYDGTKWQLYPLPNQTIVRSLGFGPGGRLYVGGQDELGYFEPDASGRLRFQSLRHLLPAGQQSFADVWQLEVAGEAVFFRTDAQIFRLADGNMETYPSAAGWLSLHQHQGQVLAHHRRAGLLRYQQRQWHPLIGPEGLPANFFITDVMAWRPDTSLLATVSHGLYLLTGRQLIPFRLPGSLSQQHFTSLAALPDGSLLAGTYLNGLYHIAASGAILEKISGAHGLPNNTVRCLLADDIGNAWIGLDNGLACFNYTQAIRHINPAAFNNGFGYDARAFGGYLYFALSTGLQRMALPADNDICRSHADLQPVLSGLTWNLSVLNKQLLVGRDDGLYVIGPNGARATSQSTGYWGSRALQAGGADSQVVAGNYLGLRFFRQHTHGLTDAGSVPGFAESSRYLETDSNCIWVSHPYRGVYRIQLPGKTVRLFTEKDGLPSRLDNHVFKIAGQIVFATPAGIYEYHAASQTMRKAPAYEAIFGNLPIRYLKEDSEGHLWFVQQKMLGVVNRSGPRPTVHYIPELNNKILSGFENIYPFSSQHVLVGGDAGFYHINYEAYRQSLRPFDAYITQVKTTRNTDSVLLGGFGADSSRQAAKISLPFGLNSLAFSFASSTYHPHHRPEYSYYLQGFDAGWSEWSPVTSKEYTNLPAGSYTFLVKARQSPSHESTVYQYSFSIQPPWYQTVWARLAYALLGVAAVYSLLKYQSRRHRQKMERRRLADQQRFEEEQRQLAYQHQLQLAETEKELIRLQYEKLAADIQHKNSQLASTTMNLVQKKEFILKLKAELQQLQKAAKVGDDNPELKKLLKALAEEEKLDAEWEQFSQHFTNVHGDFITKLKNSFPALKPHELRLCVYLRLNLSSKEIAPLMSISVRGVEISRYRLRKKMGIPTEVNLTQFLMEI